MIIRGAHFIRNDLSLVVVELQEELEEHRRQEADPESIPVLQLSNVDFSYGHVQVLFGVSFEVQKGEVLALLGTNGAGKSTALQRRVGPGDPGPRGRASQRPGHHLRHTRAAVPARHPPPAGWQGRLRPDDSGGEPRDGWLRLPLRQGRTAPPDDRVYELFPALRDRAASGPTRCRVASSRCWPWPSPCCTTRPVLMIDELSLGLAPIMVQELIEVIDGLKAAGVTMIIVEQSLNVAAAIADRAVFLEKGRVRFEGQIRDLMERDDLARAVFLGGQEAD